MRRHERGHRRDKGICRKWDGAVDREGHVWHTFYAEWHEVGAWIRWYLTPGVKKWVMIAKNNKKYRVRAVRLSKSVIYLGK